MALPWEKYQGTTIAPSTELKPWEKYADVPELPGVVVSPDSGTDQYLPPDIEEFLRTEEARKRAQEISDSPLSQVLRETAGGMMPHDLPTYLESIFPPAAMAHHTVDMGERLSHGDVSDVPFVGRIPELIAAEDTPAGSIERYRTARNTLMDLGLLAGGGEGRPAVEPPPLPSWVTHPQSQTLAIPPDPYAPKTTQDNLAAAITRARTTPIQKAQEIEQQRQAELSVQPQPIPPGVEGPSPVRSVADVTRDILDNRRRILGEIAAIEPQAAIARKIGGGDPYLEGKLAQLRAELNDPVKNPVVHAPPERRFVTAPSREVPGAQPAPQGPVAQAPPAAGPQPTSPYAPSTTPRQPVPITQTLPQAATATTNVSPSHAALVEQYGPGVIQRGEVGTPKELYDAARARAGKVDPYKAASKVTSGQGVNKTELGDLVVEHERLRTIAMERERLMNANPNPQTITDWNNARQASENFAVNVLKPAGTAWGEEGRQLQSVNPPDPMTLTGAREIAVKRLERELSEKESKGITKNTAKNQKDMDKADARTQKARDKVGPGKIPSRAEVQAEVDKMMKDLLPCDLP